MKEIIYYIIVSLRKKTYGQKFSVLILYLSFSSNPNRKPSQWTSRERERERRVGSFHRLLGIMHSLV